MPADAPTGQEPLAKIKRLLADGHDGSAMQVLGAYGAGCYMHGRADMAELLRGILSDPQAEWGVVDAG